MQINSFPDMWTPAVVFPVHFPLPLPQLGHITYITALHICSLSRQAVSISNPGHLKFCMIWQKNSMDLIHFRERHSRYEAISVLLSRKSLHCNFRKYFSCTSRHNLVYTFPVSMVTVKHAKLMHPLWPQSQRLSWGVNRLAWTWNLTCRSKVNTFHARGPTFAYSVPFQGWNRRTDGLERGEEWCRETVHRNEELLAQFSEYGHESYEIRNQKWLWWRGPSAI